MTKKRTAVVTGGASGIGAGTAAYLRTRGWDVAVLDLPAAVEGTDGLAADVTDPVAVEEAFSLLAERDLRAVINCAGIAPSARVLGRDGRHPADLFRRVVEINLLGTFHVLVNAASVMAENEPDADGCRGVVVNTASIAAFDGQSGQVGYAASKAGVAGMTLPAARDLAPRGIRVCAIAPGLIDTPMVAGFSDEVRARLAADVPFPSRLGRPEEFASLAAEIIDNPYLNGETIRIDGALRMAAR
jgi:NAD(P)-dependent dehydrogenase (short-subunit alcohol dehydrogenase family)